MTQGSPDAEGGTLVLCLCRFPSRSPRILASIFREPDASNSGTGLQHVFDEHRVSELDTAWLWEVSEFRAASANLCPKPSEIMLRQHPHSMDCMLDPASKGDIPTG